MNRHALLWVVAAAFGIALAAVITWSASQIAGQKIGLASAPLSVQHGLAPDTRSTRPVNRHQIARHPARRPAPAATAPPTATTPSAPATAAAPAAGATSTATGAAPTPAVPSAPSVAHTATAAQPQAAAHGGGDGSGDSSGGGNHRDD
jgi:hypothetical protein